MTYKETKFTAKQLDKFKKKLLKVAEELFIKKKHTFKTGEWCKYCVGVKTGKCKEYAKSISNPGALVLLSPKELKLPIPETVSDEVIKNIVLNKSKIESFLKGCYKYALQRATEGKDIKGIKVIEGGTKSKWNETLRIETIKYLENSDISPFKDNIPLRGITDIEKEIKKKKLDLDVRQFTEKPKGKPNLVGEDDPRPAVTSVRDLLLSVEEDDD